MKNSILTDWRPEDEVFWHQQGAKIATRNLWISIICLLLAFSVWVIWSVVVVHLPEVGFQYDKNQLFMLTALPSLSGATLRIFYSFMPSMVGGRRWTVISTASLLIPALWLGFAVQDSSTSYTTMLIIALLCGFGGANFSSSMANISFFYPKTQKGYANGMNAGLGNMGVSLAQFLIPAVIATGVFGALGGEPLHVNDGNPLWLQNAGFVWVPLIIIATLAAWFGMNDLATAKASFTEQAVIFKQKHTWLMCFLYLGTFGSFMGFAAGFTLLTKTAFPEVDVFKYAFIGPLLGAALRPVGGVISDRLGGGSKVTLLVFVLMILAVFGVLAALPSLVKNGVSSGGSFPLFFGMFLALFILTGLGNGSTYKMIPSIFAVLCDRGMSGKDEQNRKIALQHCATESAAAGGFIAAIGAYGGFFIPKAFGISMSSSGSAAGALYGFIVFYLVCVLVTWWCYVRKSAKMPC